MDDYEEEEEEFDQEKLRSSAANFTPNRIHDKYVSEEAKADIMGQNTPFNLNIYLETVKEELEDEYQR